MGRSNALFISAIALCSACAPTQPTAGIAAAIGEYGDNHHDLISQNYTVTNPDQGQITLWHYDGQLNALTPQPYGSDPPNPLPNFVGTGWQVRADADFYGDGYSALLLQSNDSGTTQMYMVWRVDYASVTDTRIIARGVPAEWTVIGTIDVDSDGHDDIVWQNKLTGDLSVWIMNGATMQSFTVTHFTPSPTLQAYDVGRFDGYNPSVLLKDTVANVWRSVPLAAWGVPVATVTAYPVLTIRGVDPAWREIGVGDVDRQGGTDIWWFNPTTYQIGIWLMSGSVNGLSVGYASPGTNYGTWLPVAVGDFDGDGIADVWWHRPDTTEVGIWRVQQGGNGTWFKTSLAKMACDSIMAPLGTHADTPNTCAGTGSLGHPCYWNGACNGMLACVGGTCYDPNDPSLGKLGHPCIPYTNACTDGLSACRYGACVPAGGLHQPCRTGTSSYCNAPLVCSQQTSTCETCGTVGGPCCANQGCSGPGVVCDPHTLMCITCGLSGQECCPDSLVVGQGGTLFNSACGQTDKVQIQELECRDSRCVQCGGLNGPCCTQALSECGGGLFCDINHGKVCHSSSPTGVGTGAALIPTFSEISPIPGENFLLDWSVTNFGNKATGSGFTIKVEFGPSSPGPDGPDFSTLFYQAYAALQPGQSYTGQVWIDLPADESFYVARITADADNQVKNMIPGTITFDEYTLP